MRRNVGALVVTALALVACTSAPSTASPTPALTPSATQPTQPTHPPAPSPSLASSPIPTATAPSTPTLIPATPVASLFPAGSVIVTFKVGDEEYRVLVTDPHNVAIAHRLLAGKKAPPIPNGVVVRGDPSVNVGYTWHIDPATLEFADTTTEVCDGKPSFVEAAEITGNRFCPWSARVVAIDPANP